MTFSRKLMIGSLAALLAGMLLAVGVVAAKRAIETDAVIFFTSPNTFNGEVTSSGNQCIPKRQVTVKKVRPGHDKAVMEDRSNHDGLYENTVAGNVTTGQKYYAAVAKRAVAAGTCARGRSGTTTIGP